jgi:hypothetical protein
VFFAPRFEFGTLIDPGSALGLALLRGTVAGGFGGAAFVGR